MTKNHLVVKLRKKGKAGGHVRQIFAVLGDFGKLPILKKKARYDFAIVKGPEMFYVDFRKESIIPKRGFLKPYLKYTMKKKIKGKSRKDPYMITEQITFKDKDGEKKFNFYVQFIYRRKELVNKHGSNSKSVFKITNHLLYHEYWYRPLVSRGDYINYHYEANHKYKVNIEHYYTTYLPHEAYAPNTIKLLQA